MTKPGRVNSLNELCGQEVFVLTTSRRGLGGGPTVGVLDGVLTLNYANQVVIVLPLANFESFHHNFRKRVLKQGSRPVREIVTVDGEGHRPALAQIVSHFSSENGPGSGVSNLWKQESTADEPRKARVP